MENKENHLEYALIDSWDWQTRVLHWINALLVLTLALLALSAEGMEALGIDKSARKSVKEIHAYLGYIFVFTLGMRILWGFIGNKYARWSDIIPYKKEQWQGIWSNMRFYLSGFKEKPPVAIGHNPMASLLYVPLFLVLISEAISGILLAGLEFDLLPASAMVGGLGAGIKETLEDFAEEMHEFGFLFIIFFICLHLGGLILHEIVEKAGLFSSMIHGKKYFPKEKI